MHAQTLLALLPAVAMAQYGYDSDASDGGDSSSAAAAATTTTTAAAAAASSSSSASNVHVVKVGDGGLTFSPSDIKASVGDVVEFHFFPKAHSVAQSSFDKPCEPLTNGTAVGFFSGPVPVSSGESADVFTLEVKDANPRWFYCATGTHCQSGMVGVINAPSGGQKTLEKYAAAAAKAPKNVAPASTGGGSLGPAATGTPSSTSGSGGDGPAASASGSAAASASSTSRPNAGVETRGSVRWGLLSFGVAVAGVLGGLLI